MREKITQIKKPHRLCEAFKKGKSRDAPEANIGYTDLSISKLRYLAIASASGAVPSRVSLSLGSIIVTQEFINVPCLIPGDISVWHLNIMFREQIQSNGVI